MDIKHTILMITYNQEDYIRAALNSVLMQEVLPFEIIIGDDFSLDKTREIILEYKEKYPNIIKPIFHKKNLGIYGNLNSIIKLVDKNTDIVSFLSGDDYYKDGMLKEFNVMISDNNIDIKNEVFLLMSNTLRLLPNGEEVVDVNNFKFKDKDKDCFKLKLRKRIGNRYTGISISLFNSMKQWQEDIGYWADAIHVFELYRNCEKYYFINKSFPVYRIGSGVTSSEKKELFLESWINVAKYVIKNIDGLDTNDIIHLKMTIAESNIQLNNHFKYKVEFLYYYLLSFFDVLYGYESTASYIKNGSILVPSIVKKVLKKIIRGA